MNTTAVLDDPHGADALTSDGGIVTIRPVRPCDRPGLADLYAGASRENLWLRFFIVPGPLTITAELDSLCRPATRDRLTLVAVEGRDLIGVASCARLDTGSRMAEIAAFVADHQHGRGVGTLLLEHLASWARHNGITEFLGEMLPRNAEVLRMVRDFHEHTRTHERAGIVEVDIDLTDQPSVGRAIDARDRVAERSSLRPLMAPRSVVVVGAGQRHGGAGHEVLRALRDRGFAGRLYAVNPAGRSVCGVPGHRSVTDLPEDVDLAIVAVRADRVAGVLKEAGQRGVRAAVVLSKGFDSSGPAGRQRRGEILRIAREHEMRLLGPGSIGVIGSGPGLRLDACLSTVRPPVGGLAVAAQSAAVGVALLAGAAQGGCGLSSFVSLGEKLDVSGNDLVAYWYDDPATHAVALHLESFGNPRRFARTVRALGRRKPVLAIGAATRTGVVPPDLVHAMFAQAGVIRTSDVEDTLDAARMLVGQPLPGGPRLALVGNAGALTTLAAESAAAAGFVVAPLTRDTRSQLPRGRDNPVDLGFDATPTMIEGAVETIAASGEADILLVMIVGTRTNCPAGAIAALGRVADDHPDVTMAAVLFGDTGDILTFGARRAPVFQQPERVVRALSHAYRYASWRRQSLGRRPELAGIRPGRARALIGQALAAGGGWLPRQRTAAVLRAYGITLVPVFRAATGVDAVAVAERIGFPVVVRPDGAVPGQAAPARLDLTSVAAVRDAFDLVSRGGAGVLLQRQVAAPVELTAGIRHDPLFGSVVRLADGEATPAVRLIPLTDLDAHRMWREIPAGRHPRAPSFDPAALEDLLLRLGRLAEDHPEVAELELGPIFAGPDGVTVADARLRLGIVGPEPDPTLRRLSPVPMPFGSQRGTSSPVQETPTPS